MLYNLLLALSDKDLSMRRRRNEEIIAAISFVVVVGMVVSACSDEPRRERLSEQLLMDMRSENEEVVRRACSYLLGNPDKYTERVASVLVEKLRNTGGNEAEKRWPEIGRAHV